MDPEDTLMHFFKRLEGSLSPLLLFVAIVSRPCRGRSLFSVELASWNES